MEPRSRRSAIRVEFSKEHDCFLYKYLATYCPFKEGRKGHKVFQRLVANENNMWPWSVHHTSQSWRERYVKNTDRFDALILNYQRKHNIKSTEKLKRAAEPKSIEALGPSAKRVRLEAEEMAPDSEMRTEQSATAQHASSGSSKSKLISKSPPEPQEPLSQAHPQPEPEPTDDTGDTNTDATEKPSLDLPALQTRHDTLETPSASPNQPPPPPMDGEPESRSPPSSVKRIKKRHRTPSEVFASEPSSPRRELAVLNIGDSTVTDTVCPRAPPRVVDSFHGQALVDQRGHVPRAFPHGEEDGAEEEEVIEEEEDARWPPPRGHTAKRRTMSGPGIGVNIHHAFSQTQPQPGSEVSEGMAAVEREQGRPYHLLGHASRPFDERFDLRAIAALFSDEPRSGVGPLAKSERRKDMILNGTSPVKRFVPTAPIPVPTSGLMPNPASTVLKFPAPRASTRSPFRPECPPGGTLRPAPRPQSRTKAARPPALSRIRRRTINGNANGKGNERENGRRREHGQVPSVDLVALSHSSTSLRSHSDSSTGGSISARPSRWSLPLFAHATPRMIDGPEGAPAAPGSTLGLGSGSPFRWVAPSPVYADILGRARTSSLGGTSAPFMLTPSPARSITAVPTNPSTSAPVPDTISPSVTISPHPPDVALAASHGLASILAHMSVNHGLALNVVEAVYTRVRSLRDADEVLMGMRKAAEGFGEREIERKTRWRHKEPWGSGGGVGHEGRHEVGQGGIVDGDGKEQKGTVLRYVAASEDGEGSEYSPPETSKAAMWKQKSESTRCVKEGEVMVVSDDEEEEGRIVEEELLQVDGEGENDGHHDFSRVLLEDTRAQELERQMGRVGFHKEIVKQFL